MIKALNGQVSNTNVQDLKGLKMQSRTGQMSTLELEDLIFANVTVILKLYYIFLYSF